MKAAVLEKINSPLVIRDISIPPLSEGQVLVKLEYSGVCHSQVMEVRGKRGEDAYLPHLLGHEGSGIVVEVGKGVKKVKKNDKVILGWIKGNGINAEGAIYKDVNNRNINSGCVTTFCEFSIVSENRCTIIPDGIPMDVAVLFGCAILTGAGIVTNTMKPSAGQTIAVFGLGGIGMSALMATMLYDCSLVIAVDVQEEKLRIAREIGATHTINSSTVDPVKEIFEITKGLNVDYSVESAGFTSTIEQAFAAVKRNGGLCIFASHPQNNQKICIDPYELICGKQIKGTWGGMSNPDTDIPKFAELYRTGKLPLERLLTKRYKLAQINDAIDDLEKGVVLRPLIEIGEN